MRIEGEVLDCVLVCVDSVDDCLLLRLPDAYLQVKSILQSHPFFLEGSLTLLSADPVAMMLPSGDHVAQ